MGSSSPNFGMKITNIWVATTQMMVSTLKNGWFILENPIKMGWFGGTTILGNTHSFSGVTVKFLSSTPSLRRFPVTWQHLQSSATERWKEPSRLAFQRVVSRLVKVIQPAMKNPKPSFFMVFGVQRWNLKINSWKRRFLLETIHFEVPC